MVNFVSFMKLKMFAVEIVLLSLSNGEKRMFLNITQIVIFRLIKIGA